MELKIEKTNNGFILIWEEEWEDGTPHVTKEVIEENDLENSFIDSEKVTMSKLLERVSDFFGITYDKWSKENLNIKWNKRGHKTNNN